MKRLRKVHTCKCDTVGPAKRIGWVLLEQGTPAKLKCLRCGWKWKSHRKYANQLPLHKERHRSGISNEHVLQRLRDGTLTIDPITCEVVSHLRGRTVLSVAQDKAQYNFVAVCYRGKKKSIARHVLQWMAANDSLVPEGYDVHHKYPGTPRDDSLEAIELLPTSVNRSRQNADDF